jgi:hypothetical protein
MELVDRQVDELLRLPCRIKCGREVYERCKRIISHSQVTIYIYIYIVCYHKETCYMYIVCTSSMHFFYKSTIKSASLIDSIVDLQKKKKKCMGDV